jgi:hypothetical protein
VTGFGSIKFGPFVECAKRYQDEIRSKGLEMLPDGSYRSDGARAPSLPLFSTLAVVAVLVVGL